MHKQQEKKTTHMPTTSFPKHSNNSINIDTSSYIVYICVCVCVCMTGGTPAWRQMLSCPEQTKVENVSAVRYGGYPKIYALY
jgi:hypothetical protein